VAGQGWGPAPRPYTARPPSPRPAQHHVAPPAPPIEADEELIAGRRPIQEAFVAGRPARRLLVTPQRRAALDELVLHATRLRIPVVEMEGGSLTSIAGFDGHQGVVLVVEQRRWATPEEILGAARAAGEPPFVLVLDSLEDPQNLGTLLRSAEAAGVHGVLFPTRRQAPLGPAAIKASAGATEHLRLCPVDDLPGALADLRGHGLRVIGGDGDAALTAGATDLRGPLAVVVGSEGTGLAAPIRRRCDALMRIPMRGQVGSLNAAVAGSILLYEAISQRDPGGESLRPALRPPAGAADAEEPDGGRPDPAGRDATPGVDAVEEAGGGTAPEAAHTGEATPEPVTPESVTPGPSESEPDPDEPAVPAEPAAPDAAVPDPEPSDAAGPGPDAQAPDDLLPGERPANAPSPGLDGD
jgi:23S rRNA (guanosine2251-2'-O)-methyltransferase